MDLNPTRPHSLFATVFCQHAEEIKPKRNRSGKYLKYAVFVTFHVSLGVMFMYWECGDLFLQIQSPLPLGRSPKLRYELGLWNAGILPQHYTASQHTTVKMETARTSETLVSYHNTTCVTTQKTLTLN